MFTGLIEEVGELGSLRAAAGGLRLGIACPALAPTLDVGASLAVDGVCLTVTSRNRGGVEVEAVGDSLEKTTLRRLKQGSRVNLERPLTAGARLAGHIVTGHVVGTARVLSWGPRASGATRGRRSDLEAWFLTIGLSRSWADRIAAEGSIAIDGISLTVAGLEGGEGRSARDLLQARISVIPHTRAATNLATKRVGDEVNIELDIIASYIRAAVAVFLQGGSTDGELMKRPALDIERLGEWGYR